MKVPHFSGNGEAQCGRWELRDAMQVPGEELQGRTVSNTRDSLHSWPHCPLGGVVVAGGSRTSGTERATARAAQPGRVSVWIWVAHKLNSV